MRKDLATLLYLPDNNYMSFGFLGPKGLAKRLVVCQRAFVEERQLFHAGLRA